MFCFADATGETLAALLRPGNAGANSVPDNLAVLDAALCQLPAEIAAGHREGDPERKGAAVAELTDLVDLSDWPQGTRLIVWREPLHPGAQQSLFPSLAYRYWGHYTDQGGDPVVRDVFIRAHAPRRGSHRPS